MAIAACSAKSSTRLTVVVAERALAQAVVDVDRADGAPLDVQRDREHRAQVQIGDRHRLA